MTYQTKILRIDTSPRQSGSITRELTSQIIDHLSEQSDVSCINRDVSSGLPVVSEAWIGANFTPESARTDTQKKILALSDSLIEELQSADTIVIGLPIYNFGIPASLKAWVDLVARVGVTFRYTETGPVGLLEGKRAVIAVASGGTPVASEIDFATPYLKHALGFIGIKDVTLIAADALAQDADKKMADAKMKIAALKAA